MKIGILTYYGDLNCGTNLQAFATLRAVKQTFPNADVEIIPFHGFKQYNHPYLSNCTPISIIRDITRMKKYSQFHKNNLAITRDRTITSVSDALQYIAHRSYDVIYIGADTLLELNRIPSSHDGLSAYWLSPQIKAKKILLAASSKNVEVEKLTERQKEEMDKATKSYIAMGVRDTATHSLLSNFVEKEKIEIIPDPTFSLPIEYNYVEEYLQERGVTLSDKCACIHCYKTDHWAADVATSLQKQGYQVVSLRPMPWADVVLNDMSPLEQAGIFRYFKFIITHRFHEGIYTLKNGTTPLLYVNNDTNLKTDSGNSKYRSLMQSFDLYPSNLLDNGTITASRMLAQIPIALEAFNNKKKEVEQRVNQMGKQYMDFLLETKKIIENSNA